MIVTEPYGIVAGMELVRTYSDAGKKIIQDGTGVEYDEAVDPVSVGRTYTESENDLENPGVSEEYVEAAKILLGEEA